MRRPIIAAAAAVLALALASCTPATEMKADPSKAATQSKQIALFMTHMSNEFTIALSGSVKAQVEARGYEYKVYDANKDAERQQTQIEQAVNLGVGAIIIEPVSVDGIVPAVRQAASKGTNIVIVNQRISEPSLAKAYVGADAVKTGKILMEQVVKDLGSGGELALLLGPMGSDGQIGRSAGFKEVMDANQGFTKAFEASANWETAPALSTVENWLNSGKTINAVVSQNDGMAIGAAQAVAAAGKTGQIKVYGVDATSEGLQAVLDGKLAATVGQGTQEQGKKAADAAADLIEGKTVPAETIVENVVYTKDNAAEALAALKAK